MGDVKSTVRSNFDDIIIGLLYPLHEYLARELRKAIAGLGTDEECLIEILCTHSNEDIRLIKDHYHRIFNKELEKDIIGDTSGDFRRLLVSMCNQLYRAGVLRWGTDVSAFNRIIANQSYEQLRLVFREYNALANHTVMEAIKSEMSGDLRRGFLAIGASAALCAHRSLSRVRSMKFVVMAAIEACYESRRSGRFPDNFDHMVFFNVCLNLTRKENMMNALNARSVPFYQPQGLGTNDKVLKRVILSRCERDLELIKEEFLDKYKMTLASAIQVRSLDSCAQESLHRE
ncbi:annexin B9-like [Dermacentor variabilis]|uniref:annexin B9-like n=1 Tax=Dermacentor variabilis TaxID=34621 RepID=UPI003F5C12CC